MKERGIFEEKSNWNVLKLLKIRASEYENKEFVRFVSIIFSAFSKNSFSDFFMPFILEVNPKPFSENFNFSNSL